MGTAVGCDSHYQVTVGNVKQLMTENWLSLFAVYSSKVLTFMIFQFLEKNNLCWYEEIQSYTRCPDPNATPKPPMWIGKYKDIATVLLLLNFMSNEHFLIVLETLNYIAEEKLNFKQFLEFS